MRHRDREEEAAFGDGPEREGLIAESDRRIEAQLEANEAAIRREPVDASWSALARRLIASATAAEGLAGSSVQEVDCRTTLCRVRATHPDPKARMLFEQDLTLAVAPLLPRVMFRSVDSANGSTSSVIYLARDGHDFPASPPVAD